MENNDPNKATSNDDALLLIDMIKRLEQADSKSRASVVSQLDALDKAKLFETLVFILKNSNELEDQQRCAIFMKNRILDKHLSHEQ